jgi:hypothetical protein
MGWLLKLSFDQHLIVLHHKFNSNFKNHIILKGTRVTFNITQREILGVPHVLLLYSLKNYMF